MIYPAKLSFRVMKHMLSSKIRKNPRYPYVLMLEPLFKCNLSCEGCGRIREYKDVLDRQLNREECLDAAMQAGAPVVSITGGEPLLHPDIKGIVGSLIKKKYFIYLCTNGLLLDDFLEDFPASDYMSLVVHMDDMSNDKLFSAAFKGIKKAIGKKFRVLTNTTIFKNMDINNTLSLFSLLMKAGIGGVMVSPAFSYEYVDDEIFFDREEASIIFRELYTRFNGTRVYNTPMYWDFLQGKRQLSCTPWANPTFNPMGWKSPCYLITDGHFKTYTELMDNTPWDKFVTGSDPRCNNCMLHSGFEASSIKSMKGRDIVPLLKWSLTGRLK